MNISYNWLKEYVDFDLTPDEVAAALTSIGLETGSVEEVQTVKGGLEGLVIGEVLTCEPHPNSDHMHITTVNLGQGEPVQIVCGAANVAAGQKVVVATLGTKLYDGDECFTIKKSKLRGVESNGMICAEDEIGIGTDHAGIIVLPETAVPGTLAKDYYNIKSDYVLEVDITPNRADACSHYGVARDLYAYLVQNGKPAALKKPSVEAFAVDNHDLDIRVTVENSEACPHYAGVTVKGVTVKESPEWLQNKLRIIGLRPINNVVDITNYIVHAFGQPLHCFDADKIKGGEVIVKTLPEGTPFTTLDGVERKLNGRDLMICNREEPMCIAGVFGGLDSGSTETTKDVFLESAYFHPTWVRKTARRHGLNTDASFRFERGVDPNATLYCLKLAALMVKELAGGTISSDIKDVCAAPARDFRVELSYGKVHALIGKEIPAETIKSIVTSLEMKIVGCTALFAPIVITRNTLRKEIPLCILSSIVLLICANDVFLDKAPENILNRVDGLLLLCFFVIFMGYTFAIASKPVTMEQQAEHPVIEEETEIKSLPWWQSILYIIGGLAALIYGGQLFVDGATGIARNLGVSESIIGLTLVAGGTSLPELATSIVAALKKNPEIAIGNVIGSNLFNIFFVLGCSASITPLHLSGITNFDLFTLVGSGILLWLFGLFFAKRTITRIEGAIMILCYVAYTVVLIYNT